MRYNLLTTEEREQAFMQLQTAIKRVTEHEEEEPFVDGYTYYGDIEPIQVAINQAFRWGAKSVLDTLNMEEKIIIFKKN